MKLKLNAVHEGSKSKIVLKGMTPIMFDRFISMDAKDRDAPPEQRLYLNPDGSGVIGLPTTNILSLFTAQNTDSAPKMFLDKRKYKDFAGACSSYLTIEEPFIPFTRNGKPIVFSGLSKDERCPSSGVYVHRSVARLPKGLPNPKVRPVLPMPWSLAFTMTIFPNRVIDEQSVANLFVQAGLAIGLGTFRKVFGKFAIQSWE